MSRVGKRVIDIPSGVECNVTNSCFIVNGTNGKLSVPVSNEVKVEISEKTVAVNPLINSKFARMIWGTTQRLIENAICGVAKGFSKRLEMKGVGYRGQIKGSKLLLQLGFSHDVEIDIPSDIKVICEKPTILLISSSDKQKLGEFTANIRRYRLPEPYKGKGIMYEGEFILRKEGKRK